jgi:hypothetical protein
MREAADTLTPLRRPPLLLRICWIPTSSAVWVAARSSAIVGIFGSRLTFGSVNITRRILTRFTGLCSRVTTEIRIRILEEQRGEERDTSQQAGPKPITTFLSYPSVDVVLI